jgi:hypothetical protein
LIGSEETRGSKIEILILERKIIDERGREGETERSGERGVTHFLRVKENLLRRFWRKVEAKDAIN